MLWIWFVDIDDAKTTRCLAGNDVIFEMFLMCTEKVKTNTDLLFMGHG